MNNEKTEHGIQLAYDDFQGGFRIGSPDAQWFYFNAGDCVGDDGRETTSVNGLEVVAGGTHPQTGQPAFRRTLAQEAGDGQLPGSLDHVKWLVYMNHQSSRGYPGFEARPGQTLTCETWLSCRTFGTATHPFGAAIQDPDDDFRLACGAMNTIDFETGLVFNFFLTNRRIYALYERLPFMREALGDYAAFTLLIPVAERSSDDSHHLKIAYDTAMGRVTWFVDKHAVYRINQLGRLGERRHLVLDHGGAEVEVAPRQLACGMGMFTLLDSACAGQGLVRLSNRLDYWNPGDGPPVRGTFLDDRSLPSSRLFGQGAQLRVQKYIVSSLP